MAASRQKKSKVIRTRFTPEEVAQLQRTAEQQRLDLSKLIRQSVLSALMDRQVMLGLIRELTVDFSRLQQVVGMDTPTAAVLERIHQRLMHLQETVNLTFLEQQQDTNGDRRGIQS